MTEKHTAKTYTLFYQRSGEEGWETTGWNSIARYYATIEGVQYVREDAQGVIWERPNGEKGRISDIDDWYTVIDDA